MHVRATLTLCTPPFPHARHPTISTWERDYIEMRVSKKQPPGSQPKTPWRAIFTSIPVWAVVVTCFCNNWGFYTLLTCLPTYFNDVLRFSIEDVCCC